MGYVGILQTLVNLKEFYFAEVFVGFKRNFFVLKVKNQVNSSFKLEN